MQALRSVTFNVLWAGWTGVFGLTIPVLLGLRSPPSTVRKLSRVWARGVLVLLAVSTGVRHSVRGASNLPGRPCLIVANHQSTWETIAALVLFPDVAIVAKRELLRIPVMGWYLRRSPMIVIDRDEAGKALREMTTQSRAALADGRPVLIFPEGTRTPVDEPVNFKRGVELLYRTLGVAVAPVALDSGRFWPGGSGLKTPGTITISILPPIAPSLPAAEFARQAETAIEWEKAALSNEGGGRSGAAMRATSWA
jgi:1-acyl-sn-glycerol-3-phosphate acyltransferase